MLYLPLAGSCRNPLEERVALGPLGTWGEECVIMELYQVEVVPTHGVYLNELIVSFPAAPL